MRIESETIHIDTNKSIVKVIGWEKDVKLGTALGEAQNVEIAEDRAIKRLLLRITKKTESSNQEENNNIDNSSDVRTDIHGNKRTEVQQTSSHNDNSFLVPEDWTEELMMIDNQLKRLNWNRDQENEYLTNKFGYPNRNKITNYDDLKLVLNSLEALDQNSNDIKTREMLMIESNNLIKTLNWDESVGRQFLLANFNVSNRRELTNTQLNDFNKLMEKQAHTH